jgi:hypothetical protein
MTLKSNALLLVLAMALYGCGSVTAHDEVDASSGADASAIDAGGDSDASADSDAEAACAIAACGEIAGCCPDGCNANNDSDCSPVCGNEVVEEGEECDGGEHCSEACEISIAAPRPLAPLSTATVTQRRPTLSWELPDSIPGARVDICADRACEQILTTFDVTGSSGRPAQEINATGTVFWRLRGVADTLVGTTFSPTWQFFVPAASRGDVDTSWGSSLDVNGDGYRDAAIGNGYFAGGARGSVFVYHGGEGSPGFSATPQPVARLDGPNDGRFGRSAIAACDVNGSGFVDLLVGAPDEVVGGVNRVGRVYIFLGSATGIADQAAADIRLSGTVADGEFGASVACAGDLNGNGFGDVIVGVPGQRQAQVFFGGPDGPVLDAEPDYTLSESAVESYGSLVLGGADFNGDGRPAVVVAAPTATVDGVAAVGMVFIYHDVQRTAHARLEGPASDFRRFGTGMAFGDFNGDGYSDLAVGASGTSNAVPPRAWVFHSRGSNGLATSLRNSPSFATDIAPPDGAGSGFGNSLAAGDLDASGFDDLLVAAPTVVTGCCKGTVHVYTGANANGFGGSRADSNRKWVLPVDQQGDDSRFRYGTSLGIGDANRDGYLDAFVSDHNYSHNDQNRFGRVEFYNGGSVIPTVPNAIFNSPVSSAVNFGEATAP